MNQEQGRIDKFKPAAWLYIFLFIYYSTWVTSAIGTILSFAKSGMEMIEGCSIKEYAKMKLSSKELKRIARGNLTDHYNIVMKAFIVFMP